ncbi:ORF4 [Simian torque teno virus 32]|uniref:ORF4 n=1 Tax=Simian torque teno virus 32 TaxID=1619220 RepID=A0A0C5I2X9_9VIRU|nr:ORF4 [Simian torque teno virus 32]AJP36573.1 ORF4 [Simian torque teno virus 32]
MEDARRASPPLCKKKLVFLGHGRGQPPAGVATEKKTQNAEQRGGPGVPGPPPAARAAAGAVPPRPTPATATAPKKTPKSPRRDLAEAGPNRGPPTARPPAIVIHRGSHTVSMFHENPQVSYNNQREYNQFELDTERELAQAFMRYPRIRPRPYEVPYYPWVYHSVSTRTEFPKVSFALRFNPFSIN